MFLSCGNQSQSMLIGNELTGFYLTGTVILNELRDLEWVLRIIVLVLIVLHSKSIDWFLYEGNARI